MTTRHHVLWAYLGDHTRNPFIDLIARDLTGLGHDVRIVDEAPAVSGDPGRTAPSHTPVTYPWVRRLPKRVARLVRHAAFVRAVMRAIRRDRPYVVICTMPTALLAGTIAKTLHPMRLVYYPFELFGEQVGRPTPSLMSLERRLLRGPLDAVITQNSERADVYVSERGTRVRPHVVRNFKARSEHLPARGTLRRSLGIPDATNVVLYEGGLVPHRWLDRLLQASLHLPPATSLVFLGDSTPWWNEEYGRFRSQHPEAPVHHLRGVPHDQVAEHVVDADVGVIIYDDSVRNHVFCEPGKLSDYVSMSVPVVAPDFPTVRQLVADHGLGVVFSDSSPEGIAAAIRAVLATPGPTWSGHLEEVAPLLTWETQRPALVSAVFGPAESE